MCSPNSPDFQWQCQPAAAELVQTAIQSVMPSSAWLQAFQTRLLAETGTRLVDWLDHIVVPRAQLDRWAAAEFQACDSDSVRWTHAEGLFPQLLITESDTYELAIKVDSVERFLTVHADSMQSTQLSHAQPCTVRIASCLPVGENQPIHVVERHGAAGFQLDQPLDDAARNAVLQQFRQRLRDVPADQGFADATQRMQQAVDAVGQGQAVELFFQSEREYWQSRNDAAQLQYRWQDELGIGWANHDHHTYRCSRPGFAPLVAFLESAGFTLRERFFAGPEAGWGAQVLEHPQAGIVIFADVDMSEQEVMGDFAHEGLPARQQLGTVGLWCQLHGDSFLQAGMHHLECQFDFAASCQLLAKHGIETMEPFTNFPHLKQAFTVGQRWQVPPERLSACLEQGAITAADADKFRQDGAIGSHLEILERNEGYKGFNQTGISKIILKTNPRSSA